MNKKRYLGIIFIISVLFFGFAFSDYFDESDMLFSFIKIKEICLVVGCIFGSISVIWTDRIILNEYERPKF